MTCWKIDWLDEDIIFCWQNKKDLFFDSIGIWKSLTFLE